MKNSKFLPGQIEIWSEQVNGNTDYWMKSKGISYSISKRKFNSLSKKAF